MSKNISPHFEVSPSYYPFQTTFKKVKNFQSVKYGTRLGLEGLSELLDVSRKPVELCEDCVAKGIRKTTHSVRLTSVTKLHSSKIDENTCDVSLLISAEVTIYCNGVSGHCPNVGLLVTSKVNCHTVK